MIPYKIVPTNNNGEYKVALPPLHWSEPDMIYITGSWEECDEGVKRWKELEETWRKAGS